MAEGLLMPFWRVVVGDALERLRELEDGSVQTCVTSPPFFGLRDYGTAEWEGGDSAHEHDRKGARNGRGGSGTLDKRNANAMASTVPVDVCSCGAVKRDRQIGLEQSPDEFVAALVEVFREVRRVLRDDGTVWLNLGDSYANTGLKEQGEGAHRSSTLKLGTKEQTSQPIKVIPPGCKPKDLIGVPWMVAFALRADGWYLRSDIIWAKPNPMPESVTDRPTKAHEYVFLLSKSKSYFYDADAVREDALQPLGEPCLTGEQSAAHGGDQRRINGGGLANSTLGTNQGAAGRNKRSVWTVATQPFSWRKNARRVRVELDDVDDGTERITSRDCPVHGDRPAPVPTESSDGREDLDLSRSPDIGDGLAQEPLGGFGSTDLPLEPSSQDETSGSPDQPCSPAANSRNTQSRRTDHALATSPACTSDAQSPDHSGNTSGPRDAGEPVLRSDESSSEPGETDARSQGRTGDGTAHRSSCTCRYYRLDETDHFAVFPPKLIEPCVKAGSAEDACGVCGAPWVRVVEHEQGDTEAHERPKRTAGMDSPTSTLSLSGNGAKEWAERGGKSRTVGFEPSCDHQDKTGTSVVLDPFSGAGTTGLVATRLGRSYIGIELNPTYAAMSRDRIRDDAPLMNYITEQEEVTPTTYASRVPK